MCCSMSYKRPCQIPCFHNTAFSSTVSFTLNSLHVQIAHKQILQTPTSFTSLLPLLSSSSPLFYPSSPPPLLLSSRLPRLSSSPLYYPSPPPLLSSTTPLLSLLSSHLSSLSSLSPL